MRRLLQAGRCAAALLMAVLGGQASAEPVTYVLDPEHSFVWAEVLHFGTSTIRVRVGPASGSVTLDRAAGRGEVGVRVPTATVDTGVGVFNARLREGDLLASESQPEAFFVARNLRFDGDRLAEVRGEFTLRGTSQPLSLTTRQFACRAADGGEICGGDFEGELLRSEFGMSFGLPFIANRVRLLVQVEGRRR